MNFSRYCLIHFLLLLALVCQQASATDIDIAQTPVESNNNVAPNILLLFDGSNSMKAEHLYQVDIQLENETVKSPNQWIKVAGASRTMINKSLQINALYYNHEILYDPRVGHSNATPKDGEYYDWEDSNGDNIANLASGEVDSYSGETDVYTLTSITNTGTYTGGPERSDCAVNDSNPNLCSAAEERQNFANWEAYYQTRSKTAKTAISAVIASIANARIGFADLTPRVDNLQVAPMNLSLTNAGNKKDLLDTINDYTVNGYPLSRGYTPLRAALEESGRYFQCKEDDIFASTADSSPGNAGCPILSEADGGSCQQNFIILMTDGYWDDSISGIGNQDSNSSNAFDGGAFADSYSNTLADIAMYYYKTDLHSTLADNVPATAIDKSRSLSSLGETMHQHINLYSITFGLTGSLDQMPTDPSASFTWTDPMTDNNHKIDDVLHAAYNGRGEYLNAANTSELTQALSRIFSGINTNLGSSSAVAFNEQDLSVNTVIYRASYQLDSNRGDLTAARFDETAQVSTQLWSAAEQLENITPNNRVILTYDGDNGIPFRSSYSAISNVLNTGEVDYIRGDRSNEVIAGSTRLRERADNDGLLGDIIHSTPQYIAAPHQSYSDQSPYPTTTGKRYSDFVASHESRTETLAVGSNDGMLHVFRADNGREMFAYIPSSLIGNTTASPLKQFTDINYSHSYFVDQTPIITDVYMDVGGGSRNWATVLVGGMRTGGRGIFALDITDPSDFDSENTGKNQVLWEFDQSDDANMGLSIGAPIIAMSNLQENGEHVWVSLLANGYNSGNEKAVLFINKLEGGIDGAWTLNSDYFMLDTEEGVDADGFSNGLGALAQLDEDGNGTVDYAYAGDMKGNVYRFDLSSAKATNWSVRKIFTAQYQSTVQPISNAPLVIKNTEDGPDSGVMVVLATGSWFRNADSQDTDIHSLYGIWDDLSTTTSLYKKQLLERTLINQASPIAGLGDVRIFQKPTTNDCGNNASDPFCIDWSKSHRKGWWIDFDLPATGVSGTAQYPGERAVRNLQQYGNFAFVNTLISQTHSACSKDVFGYQLAFNPLTGGDFGFSIIDYNDDDLFDDNDLYTDSTTDNTPPISANRFDGIPSDAAFIGDERVTQSQGEALPFKIRPPKTEGIALGRRSWREI